MQDEVLEFIERRWRQCDGNWLNGNCYWFACILCTRFQYLKLYYEPIIGHFVAGTPSHYYDWSGINQDNEKPILFDELMREDPVWAQRILRDCRD